MVAMNSLRRSRESGGRHSTMPIPAPLPADAGATSPNSTGAADADEVSDLPYVGATDSLQAILDVLDDDDDDECICTTS
jgi:hypothetical protein